MPNLRSLFFNDGTGGFAVIQTQVKPGTVVERVQHGAQVELRVRRLPAGAESGSWGLADGC